MVDRGLIRPLYKTVPTQDGYGTTTVVDGKEAFTYEVTVDPQSIDAMARRAAMSKSGVANRGPLRIKITSRRRIE
jgi:hypothetical protein